MPKVDFYLLDNTSDQAGLHFACRLVAQLYRNKQSVYLHAENESYVEQIDQQLWSFRADSFLPHEVIQQGASQQKELNNKTTAHLPVVISCSLETAHNADVLINLSESTPPFYERFARLAEIVPGDERRRAILRKHYRVYKDNGCEIATHKITVSS
ncbi:MAG: DNA polymerase III subunit chi [Gammaproteobacteria bacterium]|nr:DNA polymerase III subunit chi [Gammaproteobacteria bacterium]